MLIGRESVAVIATKLLSTWASPVHLTGHEIYVGTPIGNSMFPEDGQTREVLFQSADTAMYRAEAAGHNRYCFYEAGMSVQARTRMALRTSRRHALDRSQFRLHYQPRIDLKTMSMSGMKALIQREHPELGQMPPSQLIPITEHNGLSVSIG